jgi:diguanylate cyclase (GGDEF)-like protein/PAS domain S-box-containing protein
MESDFNNSSDAATVAQLQNAFSKQYTGKIPNEYLIGARSGPNITFLAYSGERPQPVRWDDASKAVPKRMALAGKTGVIVDNDYAGKRVLAVFQPIPNTEWALVIKQPVELFMQLFYALGSIYLAFLFLLFFVLSILFKRNESRHMQEAAAREFRFKELVESTDAWVWEVDANGVYSYSSSQVYKMLGYRPDEVVGTTLVDHMQEDEAEKMRTVFAKIIKERAKIVELENYNLHKDGHRVCLLTNGSPFFDDEGNLLGYRGIDKDITRMKEDRSAIEEMAYNDLLTHLSNRRMSLQRIDEEIDYAQRHYTIGALLFIDLDEFKNINDSHGHGCGDDVLIVVARRISDEIRKSDLAGRIGGDEFIVLLRSLPISAEVLHTQIDSLCSRIIYAINQPIMLHNKAHQVGASIGVALIPQDGSSSDEVMKHADSAMYRAKKEGKNRYLYYQRDPKDTAYNVS